MLWFYNKLSEDTNVVIYKYGWNTEETTGQLIYDKNSKDITIMKIADNDTEFGAKWAASHLPEVIQKGYSENGRVQIG
uniref:Uncharacterized protein n=1 Tax=uncultured bacterium contig00031 TaxID=1181520 RepID=A0A806KEF7_9BACT|nr:hypothetical protein [uncultured bacterium contig00031]